MAKSFNDILEDSSITPLDKNTTAALRGFNIKGDLPILEKNNDVRGFVFFTRPQLNLTSNNIRNVRTLYPLMSKNETSIQRFVRTTLDPRLLTGITGLGSVDYGNIKINCPLVDSENAFIPILTNTITSLSGWPDMAAPTWSSRAGLRKEQMVMVDGSAEIYNAFDLSATFENFKSEVLTLLFETWMTYPTYVFEGVLNPYIDFITENEIDYNTRIYRFITDASGRYIKKAASTGASFPNTSPTGKFFDYDRSKPLSSATGAINVVFKCMGAMYFDDIVLRNFNQTQAIFNSGIRKYLDDPVSSPMVEIPYSLLEEFDYKAYPIIDLETYELKWLINENSHAYAKMVEMLSTPAS